ncbi:hypothetical protein [Streptomyces sp. YKOK-I1]
MLVSLLPLAAAGTSWTCWLPRLVTYDARTDDARRRAAELGQAGLTPLP